MLFPRLLPDLAENLGNGNQQDTCELAPHGMSFLQEVLGQRFLVGRPTASVRGHVAMSCKDQLSCGCLALSMRLANEPIHIMCGEDYMHDWIVVEEYDERGRQVGSVATSAAEADGGCRLNTREQGSNGPFRLPGAVQHKCSTRAKPWPPPIYDQLGPAPEPVSIRRGSTTCASA